MKKMDINNLKEHKYSIIAGLTVMVFIIFIILSLLITGNEKKNRNSGAQPVNGKSAEWMAEGETQKEMQEDTPEDTPEETQESEKEFIVCIDPGHGGIDPGSVANGYYESEQVLALSLLIRDYLEAQDIHVIMTRISDEYISLDDRVAFANAYDADLLLSVHRNLYDGPERVYGIESWIHSNAPDGATAISNYILDRLSQIAGTKIRGIRTGTSDNKDENYIINRDSNMTSLILEMGYISDQGDNALLLEHMEDYAEAIALGIIEFMENYN